MSNVLSTLYDFCILDVIISLLSIPLMLLNNVIPLIPNNLYNLSFVNDFMRYGIYDIYGDPITAHITFLLRLSVFLLL